MKHRHKWEEMKTLRCCCPEEDFPYPARECKICGCIDVDWPEPFRSQKAALINRLLLARAKDPPQRGN